MIAYPSAKIILTTRPKEGWHKSMLRTIHALHTSRLDRFMLIFANSHIKSVSHLLDRIIYDYFGASIPQFGERTFEKHNDMVEKFCLDNDKDFLKFELGDGWDPLCDFLGKDAPDMEFPHVNDCDSFRAAFRLDLGRTILIYSTVVGFMVILGTYSWALLS